MNDLTLRIDGVSKKYLLGRGRVAHGEEGLRHALHRLATAPWRALRGTHTAPAAEKEFWALKDVTFEVKKGEVLGIIGRNGAGKSTLLKILSRITEPTRGRIGIKGRLASLLEVGTGFHPELTGRENIYLNGAILGMSRAEVRARFDEIVAFADIAEFLDTPVKRYSSGMYVRLAFAVAAHLEPDILVVDEVLAVGDAEFQKRCLDRMSRVAQGGHTVLFVSHNMQAIERLCSRCLLLEAGGLRLDGPPSAVVRQYHTGGLGSRVHWEGCAGDEDAQLLATSVSAAGESCFSTHSAIEIALTFQTHRRLTNLVAGFTLRSEYDDNLAYCLFDDFTENPAPLEPGRHTKHFRIPPDTLGRGIYHLEFDIGLYAIKRIVRDEGSLTFTVNSATTGGSRFPIPDAPGYTSIFRPNWSVDRGAPP